MRRTVHKLFWIWQYDKEEAWLNEMAAQGLALVSVGICRYEFEESLPGEYSVALQFLKKSGMERENYLRFLEGTGVEDVGHLVGWVYLRRKNDGSGEPFELFSDNESKIAYLTTVIRWIIFIGALNLWNGAYNLFLYFVLEPHNPVSLLGVINLILAAFCALGVIRLLRKRKKMQEERNLFE